MSGSFCDIVIQFLSPLLGEWQYTAMNSHKFMHMIHHGMYVWGNPVNAATLRIFNFLDAVMKLKLNY